MNNNTKNVKLISKQSKVNIHNTQAFEFYSEKVEDTYSVQLALPKSYSQSNQKYPVLYVLDANIFFSITLGTARLLQYGNEIPELIVVGIGYPNENEHMLLRNRDYLPTFNKSSRMSGHANRFLSFVNEELVPEINMLYRTDQENQTLLGDSYSGLFALYTLFTNSNLFNNYIIGSPSIYWDDRVIFDIEQEQMSEMDDLRAKVFLSVGALEATREPAFARMVGNVVDMSNLLHKRSYDSLELTTHIFEDETHLSVIPATISRGLRCIYNDL